MPKAKPHPDCQVCNKKSRRLKAAKREGRCGRRPQIPDADVREFACLVAGGVSKAEASRQVGRPVSSLSTAAKRLRL